jgi:hypothetical protein
LLNNFLIYLDLFAFESWNNLFSKVNCDYVIAFMQGFDFFIGLKMNKNKNKGHENKSR